MISQSELIGKMRQKSDLDLLQMHTEPATWSEQALVASATVLSERKIPIPEISTVENPTKEMQAEEDERTYPTYKREVLIGAAWVLFGLAATLIGTMYSSTGGSVIFFGPALYGAIKIGRADITARKKA